MWAVVLATTAHREADAHVRAHCFWWRLLVVFTQRHVESALIFLSFRPHYVTFATARMETRYRCFRGRARVEDHG